MNKKNRHFFGIKIGWLQIIFATIFFVSFTTPTYADYSLIDAFNLSIFIPLILEQFMNVATYLYNFFVGQGTGLIYILIYVFLGIYIALYLCKLYLPKDWLGFFGFNGGGEMWDGSATGWNIGFNVLKPCIRVIIATTLLLQIKPIIVTEWLVNPFLEFGAIYTNQIVKSIKDINLDDSPIQCPKNIVTQNWISEKSCNFLVQPVHIISSANNSIIKNGIDTVAHGIKGIFLFSPSFVSSLMGIITGIILILTFVSSNLFMALLIIQAIFDMCLSLIMYPFCVLTWVATKSDKWFDILPAFKQIIEALKKLVITMIACAFILCVNVAIVHALFDSTQNITNLNFGQNSLIWLSSILTIFLIHNIFTMTKERLKTYSGAKTSLYDDVVGDAKTIWRKITDLPTKIKDAYAIAHGLKEKAKK
ncbi:MAG: hypothetical protein MJ158_01430 [Alphaproteobacteria bacterium]|nr:hypothetical protein [Alphaproteobacteria bacterium]